MSDASLGPTRVPRVRRSGSRSSSGRRRSDPNPPQDGPSGAELPFTERVIDTSVFLEAGGDSDVVSLDPPHHLETLGNAFARYPHAAAAAIQRLWRRYLDRKTFTHYRDLVAFHERGDPAAMLATINPKEAELADAAAGVRVRFRLAGPAWPPTIVYKIYAARSLIDIGAFAPRDYTKSGKWKLAVDVHSNPETGFLAETRKERERDRAVYNRVESNDWRPVATTYGVPVSMATFWLQPATPQHIQRHEAARDARPFHWSRLVREDDRRRARRKRRIEWMTRLYSGRNLAASNQHLSVVDEAGGRGEGGLWYDREGAFADDSDDDDIDGVDDLVFWSSSLDFEEYHKNWLTLGASEVSNAIVERRSEAKALRLLELRADAGNRESSPGSDVSSSSPMQSRASHRVKVALSTLQALEGRESA